MRVLLLGNKNLAVKCMDRLLRWQAQGELELVALVANPGDDGIGTEWMPSAISRAAELGVAVHQPRSVSDPEFRDTLLDLRPDAILSAQYDRILKPDVIALPPLGTVNVHFAALPRERGMMPLVWAMAEGGPAGVTMHHIDPGIDTGDVVGQTILPIERDDTAYTMYLRASQAGALLVDEYFLPFLKGEAPRIPQDEGRATYHSKGYPNDRWIDWTRPAEDIDRFVRALTFPGFPAARTVIRNSEVEVLHPVRAGAGSAAGPGEVITAGERLVVAAARGTTVEIARVCMGGSVVDAASLLDQLGVVPGVRATVQDPSPEPGTALRDAG